MVKQYLKCVSSATSDISAGVCYEVSRAYYVFKDDAGDVRTKELNSPSARFELVNELPMGEVDDDVES